MLRIITLVLLGIALVFYVLGIVNKKQNLKNTSKKFLGASIGFAVGLLIVYVAFSGGSETEKFTNKFGSPDTVCYHSGCSNKIASSGDTNCCTTHSKLCGECGCYIDEDALFCMSCIKGALSK